MRLLREISESYFKKPRHSQWLDVGVLGFKVSIGYRAVPYIMIAFSMSNEGAAIFYKDILNLLFISDSH
jgi:hypothetical protein